MIRAESKRAAALTEQLLSFGRKQVLEPRILDPRLLLQRAAPLLQRALGPQNILAISMADAIGHVEFDPGRFEQVLMHLTFNARDAMPAGGRLEISLANEDVTIPLRIGSVIVPEGHYVRLSLADSGPGMDEAAAARIFEPFLSTHREALLSGSGLTLPAVYGLVRQSGGYLAAQSAPGSGTTFSIYLPRVDGHGPAVAAAASAGSGRPASVLIAEDEPAVRQLLERALTRAGMRVAAAADITEARALIKASAEGFDVLLTDVVMPGGSGHELADELVATVPDLKVIFMSGYTDDIIARSRASREDVAFLQKPFSAADAVAAVRSAIR